MGRIARYPLICLIALSGLPLAATGAPTSLSCTAPTMGQTSWHGIDPGSGDSTQFVECYGGTPLVERLTAYLWFWPYGYPTPTVPADSLSCDPGAAVSFSYRGPGTYWTRFGNSKGVGCAGNAVTVAPDNPTSVELVPSGPDRVVLCVLFDVQGRRIARIPWWYWYRGVRLEAQGGIASGIYFMKAWTAAGRSLKARRVVVVR